MKKKKKVIYQINKSIPENYWNPKPVIVRDFKTIAITGKDGLTTSTTNRGN